MVMNRRIYLRVITVIIMTLSTVRASAIDLISVDPLWNLAVLNGSDLVMKQYNQQTSKMLEVAALQNSMALHYNAIKGWQRKYNAYLKTAESYAEAFNAGTRLTSEAVRTMRDLLDLKKAITRNPEGTVATLALNNLYSETILEFIKTFYMLKYSVSTGGEYNMLTGKERAEMLWALVERMEELNHKVRQLIISVGYSRIIDIWDVYTRGMFDRHKGDIASRCLERWNRTQSVISIFN